MSRFTELDVRELRRRLNLGVPGARSAAPGSIAPHNHVAEDIVGGNVLTVKQLLATIGITTDGDLAIGAGIVSAINLTSTRTATLPDRGGELMLTTDTPASHTHAWGDMIEPIWPHLQYVAKTANYPLTSVDCVCNVTANSPTITLPTAVGSPGKLYIVKNSGAGVVTLATTSAQTIDGGAPGTLAAGVLIRLVSTGANWISV